MMMMIMMMMMIIIIIIIIIMILLLLLILNTFKGAVRDLKNKQNSLLTAPQTVSNAYAQVAQAQLCVNHVQQIEHSSHVTCVTRHVIRRESSSIKFVRV